MYPEGVITLLRRSWEEKIEIYLLVDLEGGSIGGDLNSRTTVGLSLRGFTIILALALKLQEGQHLDVDAARRGVCSTVDRDVVTRWSGKNNGDG